ncbi:sortase [Candidatus Gracilibacteria bacterium]|nr:sortase [Candidatus Gracilibacteria bacterium]
MDENGVELKSSETGKTFGEQGSFDGYELISEGVSDDGHTKTYVFRKKPSPKPTKPKPVVKTTKWVDENGVELKDISTGETFGEQGVFDGYEFMSEEVNGDEKVYKFKKIMKTTKWLDENNEELKSSETGKDFRDKGSFDGYEFISAETNGDEKVYKFKKKAEPKPVVKTTKWVSENGVELKDISTGETFGESGHFSGYTLKKVILSDDKNTKTYIFEKKKEEVKPHPEPEQKPEYTTTTGHGGGYDPKKKADYAFNGSVLKEVFGFGKEDKTEEKEVVEEKEEGRVEFFPNVIQGESEFVKYPSELPQMGNKLQELIYDRAGIIPLRFRGLLEVRLPSKEVFRLAGSENSDLDFWLDVVPEEDRNKDKYIVLPTQGLVMPINTVDKTEQAYSDFINGENQNFNNFMHDGAIEIPGTSTRGYGEVGNKMIAGHSSYWYSGSTRYKTHFQKIIGMEEGEEIWVYERDAWSGEFKRYVYRVHSSYNTSKYDVDVLKPVDTKQLTLMTCTPIGGISGRWIVKGEFVGN